MTCNTCKMAELECDCDPGTCADCDERLYGPPEETVLPNKSLIECDFSQLEARALAASLYKGVEGSGMGQTSKPMCLIVLDVTGNDVQTLVDTDVTLSVTGRTCRSK
jgi:hypothetical protein